MRITIPRAARGVALAAACLLATGSLAWAKIERLTLPEIVAKSDGAVVGRIVESTAFKVDGEDGTMYFTRLRLEGRSLVDGAAKSIDLTYPGGWISPDEGADNSEAPTADEVRLGREVVVFHVHNENMGNGVGGDSIYAWHGGLFPVVTVRGRSVVQGRGEGYALTRNWTLSELDAEITRLAEGR